MANLSMEDAYKKIFAHSPVTLAQQGISLLGMVIQLFIVAVPFTACLKGRSIAGADKIIISIGISRTFYYVYHLLYFLDFGFNTIAFFCKFFILSYLLQSSTITDLWLSALLSIFFYIKISTFHNIFFLRLKAFISEKVVYLIVVLVLLPLGYSFIHIVDILANVSDISGFVEHEKIFESIQLSVTLLPALMFLVASMLLIILLGFHIHRMSDHSNVMASATNIETFQRTMKFTLFSFLSCALYIIFTSLKLCRDTFDSFWVTFIINMLPSLRSLLLVYVVTKLRNQFFGIVLCGCCRLIDQKAPVYRAREPVEKISL